MKLRLMISTLCIATIGMVGCASQVTQPDEYSGFLSDYSRLKPAKVAFGRRGAALGRSETGYEPLQRGVYRTDAVLPQAPSHRENS